jgi:hypothetical protein
MDNNPVRVELTIPISFARPKEMGERKGRHEHQPQGFSFYVGIHFGYCISCGSRCSWTSAHRLEQMNV